MTRDEKAIGVGLYRIGKHACRIHLHRNESEGRVGKDKKLMRQCEGAIIVRESVWGATLVACEKGWQNLPAELWPKMIWAGEMSDEKE